MSITTVNKLARRLSWLIAAILVLLPFHAIFSTWAGSNFGHLDVWRVWKEILLLLALPFIAWYVMLSKPARTWLKRSPIVKLFAAYVLLHLLLGVWVLSQHKVNQTAFIYALIINLRFIGFFIFCAAVCIHSDFLLRHWRKILLVPAGVVVAFGLLQKFLLPYDFLRHFGYGPKTIPAYQTVDANLDYRRLQSTLRGANPLGAYLVLVVSAITLYVWKSRTYFLFIVGGLILLFFSYSRSAELGLVISLVFLAWASGFIFPKRWWAMVGVGLVIFIAGLAFFLRSNSGIQDTILHTSNSSTSLRSSNAERLRAMENGAQDILRQPFGTGPGTAGPASFRNNHPPRIAENYFLQVGQEVGVIGMALFIAINILVARGLWQKRSDQLAQLLLASLIGLTFVNLLSHAWTDDTISYIWWGLAGVAIAPRLLTKTK